MHQNYHMYFLITFLDPWIQIRSPCSLWAIRDSFLGVEFYCFYFLIIKNKIKPIFQDNNILLFSLLFYNRRRSYIFVGTDKVLMIMDLRII